ncbi:MAG: nucleoside hydrolase [Anaerolineae bacterium]|nr:nucleoside hydrolase [Phycisphaerae bacterium]
MANLRHVLIDTDTASDDAVALIMALRAPEVLVEALTVVSGNVALAQGLTNALLTAELCGSNVPVFAGAARPLLREPSYADWFHGKDGLGDMNYPPPKKRAEWGHAVDVMIDCARRFPGMEFVTLGPLTNLALAIAREPDIVKNISRCVVMGGNPCCVGNVTPAAEYNIWCDPEAAEIVMHSGLNLELIGWQLCRGEAKLLTDDIARIRAIGTPLANFTIDCNRTAMDAGRKQSGEIGIALPDPVAMAVAIDPTIALDFSSHRVEVECASELTRGQTVVDQLNVGADGRNHGLWTTPAATMGSSPARRDVNVVWRIDIAKWKALLMRSLSGNAEVRMQNAE